MALHALSEPRSDRIARFAHWPSRGPCSSSGPAMITLRLNYVMQRKQQQKSLQSHTYILYGGVRKGPHLFWNSVLYTVQLRESQLFSATEKQATADESPWIRLSVNVRRDSERGIHYFYFIRNSYFVIVMFQSIESVFSQIYLTNSEFAPKNLLSDISIILQNGDKEQKSQH